VAVFVCVTVAVFVWVTVAVCVAPGRVAVGRSDAEPLGLGAGVSAAVLVVSAAVSEGASLERDTVGSVRAGPLALVVAVRDTAVGSVTGPPPLHPAVATTTRAATTQTRRR
jgi:hypothetical protein